MRKLNQHGIAGPIEIGLIVVALMVVSFVGYRVFTGRDDTAANSRAESELSDLEGIDENAEALEGEEQVKEEEKTEEEKKEEEKDEPVATEPVKVEEPEVVKEEPKEEPKEEEKPKKTYVQMNAVSVQNGSNMVVEASISSAQTGACYAKFKRDGYEYIIVKDQITESKDCRMTAPVSEFPVDGEWTVKTWFVSGGGTIEGYADLVTVEVNF